MGIAAHIRSITWLVNRVKTDERDIAWFGFVVSKNIV